jgi:Thermostable hemolysin
MSTTIVSESERSTVPPCAPTADAPIPVAFPGPNRRAADTWFAGCDLREVDGADRARAERFIAGRYRRDFGAHVDAFMPRLLVLRDEDDTIRGALGLRSASGRLFVEQYLDDPIERAIGRIAGYRVDRSSIVEVGHFTGLAAGAMRALIALLTARLHREGVDWVTFAATRALRNAFLRMRLVPAEIGIADPHRLPATSRAAWGTYYAQDPRVYAGHVGVGAGMLLRDSGACIEEGA